jgi:hypothetical protein
MIQNHGKILYGVILYHEICIMSKCLTLNVWYECSDFLDTAGGLESSESLVGKLEI